MTGKVDLDKTGTLSKNHKVWWQTFRFVCNHVMVYAFLEVQPKLRVIPFMDHHDSKASEEAWGDKASVECDVEWSSFDN